MIDTATNTVVTTILVGISPIGIALSPDGAFAYVGNNKDLDSRVSVIDTQSHTVVATVPVDGHQI